MSRGPSSRRAFVPYAWAELVRRTESLEDELRAIRADVRARPALKPAQHRHLRREIQDRIDAIREALAKVGPSAGLAAFADLQSRVVEEMVTAHDLLELYRDACALRWSRAAPMLAIADAVATDSYDTCHTAATKLGLRGADGRAAGRYAPPLVHLEPQLSPSTLNHVSNDAFRSPRRYRRMNLPISIVVLPADYIAAVSLLTTIDHEVGHLIQRDFELGTMVEANLARALARVPSERREIWQGWTSEIVADVFGIFLGHVGYADVLASMLVIADACASGFDVEDEHPPPLVRRELLACIFARAGLPRHDGIVPSLERSLGRRSMPKEALPYLADCDAVATAVLDAPLTKRPSGTLRHLFPNGAADATAAAALAADMLRRGTLTRPAARLVPSAARIAVLSRPNDLARTLVHVQRRALGLFAVRRKPSQKAR